MLIGCPPGGRGDHTGGDDAVREGARVGLLGMPRRIPAVRQVYEMPPIYYDPSDADGHPVLVVSVDPATRKAMVVTRTTKIYARGPDAIVHPAQPQLGLREVGWWRMAFPKPVVFAAFDAPDVQHCGELDEATWAKVDRQIKGAAQ